MIHRSARPLAALVVAALLLSSGAVALAHGESITVQPTTAEPGDTITVTAEDLGAERTVELKLAGSGVEIVLGQVQTDEDGGFTKTYTLPADLRPGQYVIATTGEEDEAITADLTITAAAAAEGTTGAVTSGTVTSAVFQPRERPFGQVLALVVVFGVLSGLGLFLARFGGASRPPRKERTALLPEVERA